MKQSNYNLLREFDSNYYLINVLNSTFIELSEYEYNELCKMDNSTFENISHDVLNKMIEQGMLVSDETDELLFLKKRYIREQKEKDLLTITIAPTLNCNFACPYCYEDRQGKIINKEEQRKIIDFIDKQLLLGYKKLNLIWFGGEPLLAFEAIKNMSKEIINICNKYEVNYNAFLTTNGYLLNDNVVKKLHELKIQQLFITLDGPEYIHNQRRCLYSGKPTFGQITKNAVNAKNNGIETIIRMNVDKSNEPYIEELRDYVTNILGLPMYLGLVREYTDSCNNEKNSYLTKQEYALLQDIFEENQSKDKKVEYLFPRQKPIYCRAVKVGTFVIDPDLNIYKCENDIGRPNKRIANIDDYPFDDEIFQSYNQDYYKWDPFEYEDCCKCDILPICMGGCPFIAIKEKKPECETYKYNFDNCIKKHILQHKL